MIRTKILFLLLVVILCAGSTSVSNAQTSSKTFETKFWQFLIGNNYKQWAPGPGQDGDFFSGKVPHGALLKLYINRTAAGDVAGLKIGSVIVQENYRSDKSLKTISVMYRTEGFNPSANDWYWIEYNPDGTVVKDVSENVEETSAVNSLLATKTTSQKGKSSSCIACHGQAGDSDYAFFNDRNKSNFASGQKKEPVSLR